VEGKRKLQGAWKEREAEGERGEKLKTTILE